MDTPTLAAYDANAAAYAAEWLAQEPPDDMYTLLRTHFTPGPTADVGCGAGRDTFGKARVMAELAPGDAILHDEERVSVSSGKRVQRLIVRRRRADPLR